MVFAYSHNPALGARSETYIEMDAKVGLKHQPGKNRKLKIVNIEMMVLYMRRRRRKGMYEYDDDEGEVAKSAHSPNKRASEKKGRGWGRRVALRCFG